MLLILLGVSLILYVLVRCIPADFVEQKIQALQTGGTDVTDEMIQNMKAAYGLDKGIIAGYFGWLGSLLKGDFGTSFISGRPVVEDVFSADKIGISFLVAFIATIFEFMIAIPLGP